MAEVVVVSVVMHCEGCAAGVRRTVKKTPGVQSYTVDFKAQKVTVVGTMDSDEVLRRVRRSGKTANLVSKSPAPAEAPPEAKPDEKKEAPAKDGKKELNSKFSFRPKMPTLLRPKMPSLLPKMPNVRYKMPDVAMPGLCNNMPKFVTKACSEFMSKGVFYAASDVISDTEK